MRILVTGSNGQLGSEVLPRLESQSRHTVLGVDLHNCDITDRDQVLGVISQFRPEAIIHGAAFTAVDLCETEMETAFRVNSLATRFIADGARRVGAHLVYVSTDYVFDGTKVGPYLEWDRPNPQSVYGRSKLGGELEIDPCWAIARTSWVCGQHGSNMVKTILRIAEQQDTLRFVDDQIGHPTFASDLAPMVIKLAVERVAGTFHTTNQGAVSWFEFAQAVLSAAGLDPARVEPVSTAELQPPRPALRPANSVLDNFAWRHHGFPMARHFSEPLAEVVAALGHAGGST
jgi:dTDP-4-dehydrorhamnose reductase